MKIYGRQFIENEPEQSTELLKKLFRKEAEEEIKSIPEDFIYCFVRQKSYLKVSLLLKQRNF